MRRGTTPKHIFETDIDLTTAAVIYLTYKQDGKTVLTKEKDELEVEKDRLTARLTQADTLMFSTSGNVNIQIRARFPDGSAIASEIINTRAEAILKEGVI